MWVNDVLVGQKATEQDYNDPLNSFTGLALKDSNNVIAIEATCVDSIDFAFIKSGAVWGVGKQTLSDSTWKYSYDSAAGWKSASFDASQWGHVDNKAAYDAKTDAMTAAKWIWPSELLFRTVFTAPAVVGVADRQHAQPVGRGTVASVEYFTLDGKRLSAQAATTARAAGVLFERRVLTSGQVEVAKRAAQSR